MLPHPHYLRDDRNFSPFHAKDFCQFLQVDRGRLSNAINGIPQPGHAKISQLFIEKYFAKLVCQQRYVFYDGLPDAP